MGGISFPYESGQSGTERPDSVEVTSPPATMRASVETAVRTAKRCSARLLAVAGVPRGSAGTSPMGGHGPAGRRLVLRPVVVGPLRRAELVRAAIDRRNVVEVLVRRRRRRLPLERVREPGVRPRLLSPPHGQEEVQDEDDLRRSEDE